MDDTWSVIWFTNPYLVTVLPVSRVRVSWILRPHLSSSFVYLFLYDVVVHRYPRYFVLCRPNLLSLTHPAVKTTPPVPNDFPLLWKNPRTCLRTYFTPLSFSLSVFSRHLSHDYGFRHGINLPCPIDYLVTFLTPKIRSRHRRTRNKVTGSQQLSKPRPLITSLHYTRQQKPVTEWSKPPFFSVSP